MKKQFVAVSIYLRGYRLNPDTVSKVLRIRPTRCQKKGGFTSKSKKFIAKIGIWTLDTESRSLSIPELVDKLFKKFGHSLVHLDEIEGVEEAYLDILVPLSQRGKIDGTLEFALTKRQIAKLSQLGLSANFTVS